MTLGAGQGKTSVYIFVRIILNKHDQKTYERFSFFRSSKAVVKRLIKQQYELRSFVEIMLSS